MIQNLIQWYVRKKVLRGLRRKYVLDIAVKNVLKDWITASIIERKQEGRRKELTDAISEVKEMELFAKWLNTQR